MPGKFFLYQYEEGDIVTFKKAHPCGSSNWLVLSVGGEVKCKCTGCGRIQEFKRDKIEKATKAVKKSE